MLEITYNLGPKVVLVGPAFFSPDFCNSGYLLYGKLTVSTPEGDRPSAVLHPNPDCRS